MFTQNIEKKKNRPPVISIMGHVNHGKTTLLDYICNTCLVKNEYDNITQRIQSYQICCKYGFITFFDTPGHCVFDSIRNLSILCTDIILLLVAVDDGVMPQTVEIINEIKKIKKSVIIVFTKIDKVINKKENINVATCKLADLGLVTEEFGGDILTVEVSAKTGYGVDKLLSTICLQAEMLELKNILITDIPTGIIFEARVDKGLGIIISVLIKKGTIKKGDIFLSGSIYGKIRFILDMKGIKVNSATPSMPCEIIGSTTLPVVGNEFLIVNNEKIAKKMSLQFLNLPIPSKEEVGILIDINSLENSSSITGYCLNVILKVDVYGSIDAISKILQTISNNFFFIKIIKTMIGDIIDSDINLAVTYKNVIVIGFNVKIDNLVKKRTSGHAVEIVFFKSVYELEIFFKLRKELYKKDTEGEICNLVGVASVRTIFITDKNKKVAGCFIEMGIIRKNHRVSVIRNDKVIYTGSIKLIKSYKKNVNEIFSNMECGITLTNFEDFHKNDYIKSFLK